MVIDVGANAGQFSLLVRDLFGPVPIVAFEPIPDIAAGIERAVGPPILVVAKAAGSRDSTSTLFVTAAQDSSSLFEPAERQLQLSRLSRVITTIEVEVVKLDDVVAAEAGGILLKIDVQGGEVEVLRGATTLLAHVQWVYVEASFEELYAGQPLIGDVHEILQPEFRLVGVHNVQCVSGRQVQADFLFERVS